MTGGIALVVATLVGRAVGAGDEPTATDPGGVDIPGGLTTEARWFVALMGVGALVFILVLLRRRQLQGKYALLWTGLAAVLGLLGLFPGLLTWISEQIGIYYPPALFLLVAVGFLFGVVIQFSWELSRLSERSRRLAEEVALLRAEANPGGAQPTPAPTGVGSGDPGAGSAAEVAGGDPLSGSSGT